MIPPAGSRWCKRYVTREIVGERAGGYVEVRDTWRDGFSRIAMVRVGDLRRWLKGAIPA